MVGVGALSERLALLVDLDPKSAVSGLTQIGDAAQKHLGGAQDQLNSLGGRLQSAGDKMLKFGLAGAAAGGLLVSWGDREAQSSAQLETAITNAGQSAEDFKGKIDGVVSSGESFGHTAIETKDALTTLVSAYGDTTEALNRMQLVEDLAAEQHISLASAADLVAKVHGGSTRVLKQFDIQVQDNADGTKNYEGALDQLSQKVSGQASASIQGLTGWLKEMGAVAEDDVASFGEKWGPLILAGSSAVAGFGAASQGASAMLGKLSAARAADAAALEVEDAALAEGSALMAAFTGESAAAIASMYELEAAAGSTSAAFGPLGLAVAGGIVLFSQIKDIWGANDDLAAHASDTMKYVSMSADDLRGSLTYLSDEGSPADYTKTLRSIAASGDDGIAALKRYQAALKEHGQDTSQVDQILQEFVDKQNSATTALDVSAKGIDQASKAVENYSSFIDQLGSAMDKQYESMVSGIKLHAAYEGKIDDLTESIKKNGFTLDDTTKKGRENLGVVLDTGKSIEDLIKQRFEETHSTEDAMATGTMYTEGLKQQLAAAGLNKDQIQQMIYTMGLTPGQIATTFSNNAVEQQIVIQKYITQLDQVPPEIRSTIESEINQGQYDLVNEQLDNLAAGRSVTFYPVAGPHDAPAQHLSTPGQVLHLAAGGLVDAPEGMPVDAVVHGGEFMLTADQVNSLSRGGKTLGLGAAGGGGGGGVHVENHFHIGTLIGEKRAILDILEEAATQGFQAGPNTKRMLNV